MFGLKNVTGVCICLSTQPVLKQIINCFVSNKCLKNPCLKLLSSETYSVFWFVQEHAKVLSQPFIFISLYLLKLIIGALFN